MWILPWSRILIDRFLLFFIPLQWAEKSPSLIHCQEFPRLIHCYYPVRTKQLKSGRWSDISDSDNHAAIPVKQLVHFKWKQLFHCSCEFTEPYSRVLLVPGYCYWYTQWLQTPDFKASPGGRFKICGSPISDVTKLSFRCHLIIITATFVISLVIVFQPHQL